MGIVEELVEIWLNEVCDRGKDKYLVCWKGSTVESDTWKGRENLKNTKEAIKEFEKEYRRDMENMAQQEHEEGTFQREELPGKFTAKMLYRWSDRRYDQKYWGRLEKNWRRWKGKKPVRKETMKTIPEEEETEEKESGIKE